MQLKESAKHSNRTRLSTAHSSWCAQTSRDPPTSTAAIQQGANHRSPGKGTRPQRSVSVDFGQGTRPQCSVSVDFGQKARRTGGSGCWQRFRSHCLRPQRRPPCCHRSGALKTTPLMGCTRGTWFYTVCNVRSYGVPPRTCHDTLDK